MNESIKTGFWVLLYSFMAGICLAIFMQLPGFEKYLFSLLTIYIGFRFFRRFETIGKRILFVVLSVVISLITVVSITAYLFIQNPEQFAAMI